MAEGDNGEIVGTPDGATDGEDEIPAALLWAMRTRMHSRRHLEPGEDGHILRCLGTGDDALYVIDDGIDHCMVGRLVGHASDGCTYCLVARISLGQYADLEEGDLAGADVFSDARDISLCGVFAAEQAASNVILVQHYTHPGDVPVDYLPPSPFIEFTDDSESDADTDVDSASDDDSEV